MFMQIIFGGGVLSILIWLLLFITSTVAVAICTGLLISIRKNNFIPVKTLDLSHQNTLSDIYEFSQTKHDTYSEALKEIVKQQKNPHKSHEESAMFVIDKTAREYLRQINTLQTCGNIAPMLGLLGTVTGMVSAFMGLGTAMGPEKASVLAVSISQALYTTAAGLLIAVPCLALVNFFRNTLEKRIQLLNDELGNVIYLLNVK